MRAPIRKIAFGTILACFGFASSPGAVRNRIPQRDPQEKRDAVEATRRVIRLVDADGRPVEGAIASTHFQRDCDRERSFRVPEPTESVTSNSRGLAALELKIPGHLDGVGIYAIRPAVDRPLVGLRKVTRRRARQADHHRHAPGLSRALPDREHEFSRPGKEVSRRARRPGMVASCLRCAGRRYPWHAARCLPAQRTVNSNTSCRRDASRSTRTDSM